VDINEALDLDPSWVFLFLKEHSLFDADRFKLAWQTLKSHCTQATSTNSAMDAISALRDCVELIDGGVNRSKIHLSNEGDYILNRAKDVLKLHQ